MRYEAKHQEFKRISKKKQGFKDHHRTIIETFVGQQNIKLNHGKFMKISPIELKEVDNICIYVDGKYYLIKESKNGNYQGNRLEIIEFDSNYMCHVVQKTDETVTGNLMEEQYSYNQIIFFENRMLLLTDRF